MHTQNRKRVKKLIVALGLSAVLIYGYYEFRGFLYGPELSIESPQNGTTVETPVVDVSGTTKRISKITLNGGPIFVDEKGLFSKRVPLVPGHNYMTVSVEDRFGNVKTEVLEVIYVSEATPQNTEALPLSVSPVDEPSATSSDSEI